jgi:hypothetical protein
VNAVDLLAGAVIAGVLVLCVGVVVMSASDAGRGAGRRIARDRARPGYLPIAGPGGRDAGRVHRRRVHPTPDEERRLDRAASRPRRRG